MPPIYECIDRFGIEECPMGMGHGYFRDIFKVEVPATADTPSRSVVVRIMRPKKYDDVARDLQRHVRESILLYRLQREEEEFIQNYRHSFVSQVRPCWESTKSVTFFLLKAAVASCHLVHGQ